MSLSRKKVEKLAEIARLYYKEDKGQSEIAELFGISRPLISRYLKEAKDLGIVNIEIKIPDYSYSVEMDLLKSKFSLQGGLSVSDKGSDDATNKAMATATVNYLKALKAKSYGIGWGTAVGYVISALEERTEEFALGDWVKNVCPLLGNSEVSARNYHPNELIRVFAEKTGATPTYLYAPIVAENFLQLNQIQQLNNYKNVYGKWKKLDVALVNIGNYPSTPDFASNIRYGNLLQEEGAIGRMLGYFFNGEGKIIYSENDFAVQIPLQLIKKAKHVVGICSANTKPKVLRGALQTGMLDHIITPEHVLAAALEG